ncbi:MAG: YceI family protein [Deltaproteobacteria bacterium]|nr:YceI family protein [Deltaproteobacteria bacterium]
MRTFSTAIVIALALAAGACGKKKDGGGSASGSDTASGSAAAGSGAGTASGSGAGTASGSGAGTASGSDQGSGAGTASGSGSGSGSGSAAAVDPNADYVHILGHHNPAKDGDPVVVSITKFSVVKATFDPAKLDGATAELSLDLSSVDSGMAKRDNHLMSPDLLDTAKFATATIKIDNVKGAGDKKYTADATASLHGVEKKLPVTFEVLDATADSVRVKGKATFNRFEFQIGKDGDGIPIANDQEIEIQLTLKKT